MCPRRSQASALGAMSNQQCGLYLAPSSIPSAGLGIFAGVAYPTGSRIGASPLSTVGVPVVDPVALYEAEELISEFGWNAASVGGFTEAGFGDVFTLLIGGSGAMLANFHPTLGNVLPGGLSDVTYMYSNRGSPGTGAYTSYDNFTFVAKTDIQAGEEILASVNENWYDYLREKKPGIFTPTKDDYERADTLVKRLADFRHDHNGRVTDAQFLDMVHRIKTEMLSSDPSKSNSHDASIIQLLPSSLSGFDSAAEKGTARSQLNERSLDWLERNGRCLDDTIASGASQIANAGRGAFAKRPIREGSIITTIPLVQVDKENLDIDVDFIQEYHQMEVSNRQLLINYCFGHRKSEILLCPTTSVALVNHNKEKANAKIRWSDFLSSSTASDITKKHVPPYMASLDEIDPKKMGTDVRLVFDLVATTDIREGDEIYLDYGDEWETAWNDHLRSFVPSSHDGYVPASALNADEHPILMSDDPDLVHHAYLCRLEPFAREDSIKSMPVEDYRANPSMEPDGWGDYTRKMYADNDYMWWWPCDVVGIDNISSDDGRPTYETIVYEKGSIDDGWEPRVIRKLKNVPRTGIKFVDRPYHSNQHLPSAFRHYIPIPDEIFPLHWRNDYRAALNLGLGYKNVGDADHSRADEDAYEETLREAKCGVWVAPSNIKGAGNGIFLGVDTPGSGYVLGTTWPIIPVSDMSEREHWDAADYTWASSSFETEFETGPEGANQIQSINAGSLANFHPGLVNYRTGDARFNPILDRRSDPGAGAFSDYTGFSFTSRYEVGKGEELYISYGESWFSSRSYLGTIPLSANYNEANRIVASLVSTTKEGDAHDDAPGLDADSASEFLSIIKGDVISNTRTRKVLDPYADYLDVSTRVLGRNGTAEATTENKSQEWLEQNGYCIDNIYSKRSTIEQAGLGAFARRRMTEGDVITPAPLIATYGRHMFNLVGRHLPDDTNTINLALNYQFSHPDSSLYLFPTTSALLINHRSANQRWGGTKPNAELRWSTTDRKSAYFLQRTLEDLKKEHYTTLVIDIVATRTIEPDEEITIDYGDNWNEAWGRHVANFKSSCPAKGDGVPCFKSSKVVNEMNDDKFNVVNQAWSEDHFTACRRSEMPTGDDSVIFIIPKPQKKSYTKREVAHIDKDGNEYRWSFRGIDFDHEGFDLAATTSEWYPCLVLDSSEDDKTLDVVYFTYETSTLDDGEANVLRRERMLMAEDIKFLNKPYKSDMYWEGAFRHPIEIPDSIFPPLWKDLAA